MHSSHRIITSTSLISHAHPKQSITNRIIIIVEHVYDQSTIAHNYGSINKNRSDRRSWDLSSELMTIAKLWLATQLCMFFRSCFVVIIIILNWLQFFRVLIDAAYIFWPHYYHKYCTSFISLIELEEGEEKTLGTLYNILIENKILLSCQKWFNWLIQAISVCSQSNLRQRETHSTGTTQQTKTKSSLVSFF